jgi:DNA-binding MarR family transcriptional regulator
MPYARLLNKRADHLTPSQKKLLNYILANDEEAVSLTVHDLSQRVKVSVATVVRLAKALGYAGFPEFQQELRALFRDKLTTVSRLQKAARRIRAEIPLSAAAIVMGGHVRVGLEDNLYLPDGTPASNPLLVEKIVRIAAEVGREIASPDEARSLLGLNPANKDRIRDML